MKEQERDTIQMQVVPALHEREGKKAYAAASAGLCNAMRNDHRSPESKRSGGKK